MFLVGSSIIFITVMYQHLHGGNASICFSRLTIPTRVSIEHLRYINYRAKVATFSGKLYQEFRGNVLNEGLLFLIFSYTPIRMTLMHLIS